jgi:sulfur relay (sulfurtransferase) DsrC/TusE family protein
MKHRAKVIDSTGYIKDEDDFDYLCDAVAFCNNNASAGDHCLVVEVIRSLTDYEEYGTITSWYHSREYAL